MTEIGFAPKEIIPQEVCRLEVLDADKADTYGPQIYLKLKVVASIGTLCPGPVEVGDRGYGQNEEPGGSA